MSSFMSWILSILAVVIIGTVLDIFLSEKKLGKMIRSVMASLVILMIISPIPTLLNAGGGCQNLFSGSEINLDESFLEYVQAQKIKALEEGAIKAFEGKGYKNIKIKITAKIDTQISISGVKIYLDGLVIDNPALNINKIEKIKTLAAEFLKIGKDIIFVFE